MAHDPTGGLFGDRRKIALFERLPEMILVLDRDGTILHANGTLLRSLDHRLDDVVGTSALGYVHPDDLAYMAASLETRQADEGRSGMIVQVRVRHAEGSWHSCEIVGVSLLDDPEVEAFAVTLRDLGRATPLAGAPARLRSLVDKTSDVVLLLDPDGTIQFANQTLTRLLGHDCDLIAGRPWDELFPPDALPQVRTELALVHTAGNRERRWRCGVVTRTTGEVRQMSFVAVDQTDDPLIAGIIVTARDVTQLVAMEDRLREQNTRLAFEADHDHLTGLLNRVAVTRLVSSALESGGTDDVVVLFVDLDGFKEVNDTWGHEIGDLVLAEAAHRMAASLRAGDRVGRWGGDEFVVLCTPPPSDEEVDAMAARLDEALTLPFEVRDHSITIGASVGSARATPGTRADDLLRAADESMYRAKHAQRLGRPV